MTAPVPDPRFSAQLIKLLRPWLYPEEGGHLYRERIATQQAGRVFDALMPTIAAEVEARVQAAANQRAAEELRGFRARLAAGPPSIAGWIRSLDDRAAALASPAPAPRAEEREPCMCCGCVTDRCQCDCCCAWTGSR